MSALAGELGALMGFAEDDPSGGEDAIFAELMMASEAEDEAEEDEAFAEMSALAGELGALMGLSGDEPPSDLELADKVDDLDELLNRNQRPDPVKPKASPKPRPPAQPKPPPKPRASTPTPPEPTPEPLSPLDASLGGLDLGNMMSSFKADLPEEDPFEALGEEFEDDWDEDWDDDPYASALARFQEAEQEDIALIAHLEQAQVEIELSSEGNLPEPDPAFFELELLSDELLEGLKRELGGALEEPEPEWAPSIDGDLLLDAPLWPDDDDPSPGDFLLPEVELGEEIPDQFILEESLFPEPAAPEPEREAYPRLSRPMGRVEILDHDNEEYGNLLHGEYQRAFKKGSEEDLHYTAWMEGFGDEPLDAWGDIHLQDIKQSVKQRPFSLEEPALIVRRANPDLNISPLSAPSNYTERPSRVKMSVKVGMEHGNQFFTGFTKNISVGGLFIATHQLSGMGEQIDLYFELPDGYAVQVIAEVRWVRPYRDAPDAPEPGMGVRFLDLSSQDRLAIDRYVETHETLFFDEGD